MAKKKEDGYKDILKRYDLKEKDVAEMFGYTQQGWYSGTGVHKVKDGITNLVHYLEQELKKKLGG